MEKLKSLISKKQALGIAIVVTAILLAYCIVALWPPSDTTREATEEVGILEETGASLFWVEFHIHNEARLIALVMLFGALGSYIHVATSFARHVGKGTFSNDWNWWYIVKPFQGMALAVLFYFVMRGGLLAVGTSNPEVNVYTAVATAGLVGMFSRQATDKLGEWFDKSFKVSKD